MKYVLYNPLNQLGTLAIIITNIWYNIQKFNRIKV